MIKRIVKMSFHPHTTDEFIKIFESNAQFIRKFEGCFHVELLRDQNNPSVFFTFSLWQSAEAVENYRQSELFIRVWAATKVLFNDKPQAWSVKELKFE
jgi:quinol monooxygenase YgiN